MPTDIHNVKVPFSREEYQKLKDLVAKEQGYVSIGKMALRLAIEGMSKLPLKGVKKKAK